MMPSIPRQRNVRFRSDIGSTSRYYQDVEQLIPDEANQLMKKQSILKKAPDKGSRQSSVTTAKRKKSSKGQWGKLLDFKGKQYLGRLRKQYGDMGLCLGVELACLALALGLLFFCYFRFEVFHYWVCRVYALFGYTEAEHKLGEKFLYGKYVEKNEQSAMEWFRRAAKKGHPYSAYNLAIGHLTGLKTGLDVGDAEDYIRHAASNGVREALDAHHNYCRHGHCQ